VLFREGDASDRIYVVHDGEIALTRTRSEGGEDVVATVGSGDHFGEMGPLFSLPRSASAVARTDAKLTGYTVRGFRELVGVERLSELLRR
jgi:putative ABC transport system ATP-binding protein